MVGESIAKRYKQSKRASEQEGERERKTEIRIEIRMFIYISRALAHSGQMMSASSVMKPRPTSDVLHDAQMKQSLCQCRSSNEMKRVPPIPNGVCLCVFVCVQPQFKHKMK